jgi:hypothetical protein
MRIVGLILINHVVPFSHQLTLNHGGLGFRIVDIQDGAVHEIGKHNFSWLELATRNQNGCSNPGCKNFNLIQTPRWRH